MVIYFLRKIILAKNRYKTHNTKFLAIIKAFKTRRYYLKSYKYKVIIVKNYKKLC